MKSLTTSQHLGTTINSSIHNNNNTLTNGTTANNKIATDAENLAALKAITLTPPTSIKQNKLNKNSNDLRSYLRHQTNNNSNSIGNLHHFPLHDNFFNDPPSPTTNDANNNSNNNNNNNTSSIKSGKNGFHLTNNNNSNINNNNDLSNNNKNGFNKNNLNLNIQNDKINENNKFTPDTEFVADFSTANIFIANNNTSLKNNSQSNSQNIKNNNVMTNGSGGGSTSSLSSATSRPTAKMNGAGVVNGNVKCEQQLNGQNENFADFDHNPIIYNAAGEYLFLLLTLYIYVFCNYYKSIHEVV